jgi:hypothetical protein
MQGTPNNAEKYAASWKNLRFRKGVFYSIFLGLPLCWIILKSFIFWTASPVSNIAAIITSTWILAAYLLLYIIAAIYLHAFRCPRCHERFFLSTSGIVLFKDTCGSCGLPGGALTDDAEETVTKPVAWVRRIFVTCFWLLILIFWLSKPYEDYRRHQKELEGVNSMTGASSSVSPSVPSSGFK